MFLERNLSRASETKMLMGQHLISKSEDSFRVWVRIRFELMLASFSVIFSISFGLGFGFN